MGDGCGEGDVYWGAYWDARRGGLYSLILERSKVDAVAVSAFFVPAAKSRGRRKE